MSMPVGTPPTPESHRRELSFVRSCYNHVRAALADFVSAIALGVLFPFNEEKWLDPKKKEDCKDQTPILLIHGFLGSSNNWIYHRNYLKKAGYGNIFTVNLGDPRKSIEEYSDIVAKKIEEIKRLTGKQDIVLVGHSMGGLVAQEYLYSHPDELDHVKKIITIGTPLHGTRIGCLASWISKAAKEMIYQSDFVEALQKRAKDDSARYDAISTETDHIVFPAESAFGNGENPEPSLEATGHISYLFSFSTAKKLLGFIRKAIPLPTTGNPPV